MPYALFSLVDLAINLYILIVLARAVLSWIHVDPYHPLSRFLWSATEPVLSRIRRFLPTQFGGIDFSPVLLLLALSFLQRYIRIILR